MTENNGNDRRRDIKGRIDTLGTGTNGVSGRRAINRISNRRTTRQKTDDDEETAEAALVDEETDDDEEQDATDDAVDEDDEDDEDGFEAESEEFSTETDGELGDDTEFDADEDDEEEDGEEELADDEEEDGEEELADDEDGDDEDGDDEDDDAEELADDEDVADEDDDSGLETRADDFDKRSTLEVEIDPFVRAYAARRAAEQGEESLDEYIVGSVKGYLAGLLGGDVSSPGTLEREVEVEADEIFGGLLETIADEDESNADVVVNAIAAAYDVPVDEETLVVAGLRDHEALLNGVVANSSNDLGDVSEVVQAAVETRLIEEPA